MPAASRRRLGVAQPVAVGFEGLALVAVGRGLLDLVELEAQQVDVALAGTLAQLELVALAAQRAERGRGPRDSGEEREMLRAGEAVEDLRLGGGEGELAVLVLAVEGEQPGAERPQVGRGRRAAGDEGGRAAGGGDPPGEDDLVPGRQPFGQIAEARGPRAGPPGISKAPSTQASSAPGLTIPLRGLPPISRSRDWASTVLPAPVSPVITFRPAPKRSSVRSIRSRFSILSSRSIARTV